MGIWPAIIKNNLSKIIKQNFDEVLFICLFLFCLTLSSSTSSEAEDISSAFKGADDFFSAFWGAEELKFWLKMVCLSLPSAWYCWMHWYKENNIRSNCNVFLLFLLLFQNCRECSSQISVFFFWAWSYPMLRDSFEPRRIYYFTFSSEFTAVLTLLVSAARCWRKQSVDNV